MKKLLLSLAFIFVLIFCLVSCSGNTHVHKYGEWTVIQPPTCNESGITVRYCDCGSKQSEVLYPTNEHTIFVDQAVKPTCTQEGLTEGKSCSVCKKIIVEQEPIPKSDHIKGEWIIETNPTETSTGIKRIRCTVCNAVLDEAVVYKESTGLTYVLLNNNTYAVSGLGSCKDANIVIPSVYNGKPVTAIGASAFKGYSSVKSVVIPDSVTTIGAEAFHNCLCLTSITIPNSVKTIGELAFRKCQSLKSIVIPDSVTSLGKGAFASCISLKNVHIGSGITQLEYMVYTYINDGGFKATDYCGTFAYCYSLESITLPNSIEDLGSYTFYQCKSLKNVQLSNNIDRIGAGAFYYCEALQEITLPDSITYIATEAFYYCKALTTIHLPKYLDIIGESAFEYCTSLKDVVLPDNLTRIESRAFHYCSSIESIVIPSGVTVLDYSVFSTCHTLKTVTLPITITKINQSAFTFVTTFYFEGPITVWKGIYKSEDWYDGATSYTIYCTDGTITKNGNITYYD